MTYDFETDSYTLILVVAIFALGIGLMFTVSGFMNVVWVKQGDPRVGAKKLMVGTPLVAFSVAAPILAGVNSFNLEDVEAMLSNTGYMVGQGLPRTYSEPVPVETLDGEKCLMEGGIISVLPKQHYVFEVGNCTLPDGSPAP